jgi:hypothetical protein
MPIVAMPDGTQVSFPDDMPADQIRGMIAQKFPDVVPKESVSTAADMGKSALSGVAQGAIGLAGLLPGVSSVMKGAANKYLIDPLLDATIGLPKGAPAQAPDANKTFGSENIQRTVERITGDFYKPQTTAGKFAKTVGEFLPGSLIGPGGIASRLATGATAAVGSEAAGQATEGSSFEPYARIGGALAGGILPSMAARAVTPMPAQQAARQPFLQTLEAEGVPLTAGQRSGSEALRYAESTLGNAPGSGGRAARTMEAQGEAFTSAVLRRAGINANRATPDVIDAGFTRIGQQFDDLASRNALQGDRALGNALANVSREYQSVVNPAQRVPIIDETIRDIGEAIAANGGILQGQAYQALRSRLDRLQRGSSDNQLSEALRGIRTALDNAMERTIAVTNPADMGAWREARNQYRNMLVVEKAATGAGENAAQGLISPSQLRNAVTQQGRRAYARGQGDFADLARAGEAVMKPLPQSGTQPRALVAALPMMAGGGIGSMFGGPAGAGLGALAGHAAGMAAPGLAGRALMSGPFQAYLGNQVASPLLANSRSGAQASLQSLLEAQRSLQGR